MSSKHEEVRALLSELRGKIKESRAELTGQNIRNALYGIQHMSSEHEEVRELLSVLLSVIAKSEKLREISSS